MKTTAHMRDSKTFSFRNQPIEIHIGSIFQTSISLEMNLNSVKDYKYMSKGQQYNLQLFLKSGSNRSGPAD